MNSPKTSFLTGILFGCITATAHAAPKSFNSPIVTKRTPDHRVAIEIDITGAKALYLEVTDGGDGTAGGDDWVELFNGKDLSEWKINENPESWSVKDGAIVVNGERSHLFYEGEEPFVNFELEAEIMTREHSNSGIYFHTQFQPSGWPKYGFEAQINNSYDDPQKTASLYGVAQNTEAPVEDNRWFTMNIRVEGKRIVIKVDGKTITDYTEPENAVAGEDFTRVLDKGTFALQGHDPDSTVLIRRLRVRRI